MEWAKDFINLGAAGAVILVVREFLRHIAGQRRLDRETWENHLSDSIKAQQRTADVLDRLADEVRGVRERR